MSNFPRGESAGPTPSFLDNLFDYASDSAVKGSNTFDSVAEKAKRFTNGLLDSLENVYSIGNTVNAVGRVFGNDDNFLNLGGIESAAGKLTDMENRASSAQQRMEKLREVLENRPQQIPIPNQDEIDALIKKYGKKKTTKDGSSRYRVVK
jgi:hypothetical protein